MKRENLQRANELDKEADRFQAACYRVRTDLGRPSCVRDAAWERIVAIATEDIEAQRDAALAELEALA